MSKEDGSEQALLFPVEDVRVTVTKTKSVLRSLRSLNPKSALGHGFQICWFRHSRLLLIIFLFLLIGVFVLFSNEELGAFDRYSYQSTRKQLSFVGYDENGSVNETLTVRVKTTTSFPFTQTPNLLANSTRYDKYILTNVGDGACGGVGNVIFRVAALYGIGKHLKRNACLQGSCAEEYHIEMYSMFPNLQKFPLLRNCWKQKSKGVGFASNCWNYDNVTRLEQYAKDKFINLETSYLQSHKFFHHIRNEILYMFDFSESIKGLVDDYARQMFDSDNSTKVCAHIREGDFRGGHPLLPSTEVFTTNGLNYLITNVAMNQSSENVSVLLFSDDIGFANNIARRIKEENLIKKAFVTRELNRLENIALAVRHCDYFLLTSSGSTFGWWMAYLLPDEKQSNVFYNSLFFKKGNEGTAKEFREEDFFPDEWQRMIFDPEHSEITVQNRSIPAVTI